MKNLFMYLGLLFAAMCSVTLAQEPDKATLAKGFNLLETKTYTSAEDVGILELYKNLRVADVSDGLDMVGLPGTGLVDPTIHSDWVDLKDFTHLVQ